MSKGTEVKATASAGGVGFVGLLTIVFIILKLVGKITWSWLWVLSPLWISALFWLLVIIIFVVLLGWIASDSK
jgi:hypothetical protein